MTPSTPLWNRAWQVTIDTPANDSGSGVRYIIKSNFNTNPLQTQSEPLRIEFNVRQLMMLAYWDADVTIYNLNPSCVSTSQGQTLSANQQISSGDVVTISAGYQDQSGQFNAEGNVIFSGVVFQPVWTRIGVVDWVLKLRCLCGLMEDSLNLVSFSLPAGATYYSSMQQIGDKAGMVINADSDAIDLMSGKSFPRPVPIHSKPFDAFRELMQQTTLFAWLQPAAPGTGNKPTVNVQSFREQPAQPDFSYGTPNIPRNVTAGMFNYKPSLLDVPQQIALPAETGMGVTMMGATFRVLMDSSLRIGKVVQLAKGTVVNPLQFTPFQDYPPIAARDAMYAIAGLRYYGDSRGQGSSWYTEVTGVNFNFFSNFMRAMSPQFSTAPQGPSQ